MTKFTDRYTLIIHQETFDPNNSPRNSMCVTAFLKIVQYVIHEFTTLIPLNNRIIFFSHVKPISLTYEKKDEKV